MIFFSGRKSKQEGKKTREIKFKIGQDEGKSTKDRKTNGKKVSKSRLETIYESSKENEPNSTIDTQEAIKTVGEKHEEYLRFFFSKKTTGGEYFKGLHQYDFPPDEWKKIKEEDWSKPHKKRKQKIEKRKKHSLGSADETAHFKLSDNETHRKFVNIARQVKKSRKKGMTKLPR